MKHILQIRNTTKILLLASALCILLTIFRIHYSSGLGYIFLVWNLFLAWIPFFISSAIINSSRKGFPPYILVFLLPLWLVFFPNAPYILTDLFHLKQKTSIPIWFDLMLILSYAWTGLMTGFLSLLDIQQFIRERFSNISSWMVVFTVLILSSYGVYLGRFERWNSWDIVFDPIYLIKDILDTFKHQRTFAITLLMAAFLILSYLTLFNFIYSQKNLPETKKPSQN